jgi:hypothetical protein
MSRCLRRGRSQAQADKAHIRRWKNPVSAKETLKDLYKEGNRAAENQRQAELCQLGKTTIEKREEKASLSHWLEIDVIPQTLKTPD